MHTSTNISAAVDAVRAGGVVAFPTDTFYALGADALNDDALRLAFEVKQRPSQSPMPVLIPSVDHVGMFAKSLPDAARDLAAEFWPGALTIVMPMRDDVPLLVTGNLPTVGIRVPAHQLALELLTKFNGGITGTSANLTTQPPTKSASEVAQTFADQQVFILEGQCGPHEEPSTVVDITEGAPRILRDGAIPKEAIDAVLGR